MTDDQTPPAEAPAFELTTSRQFVSWLAETGASLALSTYQSGKLILLGTNRETGKLSIFERTLERPMGIAVQGSRMAVAGLFQVTTFVDAVEAGGPTVQGGWDAVYVPQTANFTGDLDVHDMAYDGDGRLVFANTLFSCLATTSETHSFKPLWKPAFVERLAAEDRCHLNGLAMKDGRPAHVTAVARSNIADGWREHRRDGGVVVDVTSGAVVCEGLSMPHSPRWHGDTLYVLNSGAGEFGRVDLQTGRFVPMAFCPGYLRGLAFLGNHAIVGLSEPRENRTFAGLPLQERLAAEGAAPRCGLYVIDLASGDIVHWMRISGVVTELYDVAALPKARPSLIGFRSAEIRRVISVEG
ncbi:TIGR03032 family protein [Falsiroseomonas sp.]|uniref:TIGR03032 family protein n=1 Tax=Falsiroseomonas sp. TaxID=2870721 RepID=UPI003F72B2B6